MRMEGARRILYTATFLIVLVGAIAAGRDWRQIADAVSSSNWVPAAAAVGCTAVSIAALSMSYALIAYRFPGSTSFGRLLHIGFVSGAIANLTAFGGVAGVLLRVTSMERHGTEPADTLAGSAVHAYLTNLALWMLVPIGVGYAAVTHDLPRSEIAGLALLTLVLAGLAIGAAVMLFIRSWRDATAALTARMVRRVTGRDASRSLGRFSQSLELGVVGLRRSPVTALAVFVTVLLQWAAAGAAVWFCFAAFGLDLQPGILVTGMGIGIGAGAMSMVPGGFGVQEASLAGVYALFGMPFQSAILGALLFRFVYDVVPFAVSFATMWPLVRGGQTVRAISAGER